MVLPDSREAAGIEQAKKQAKIDEERRAIHEDVPAPADDFNCLKVAEEIQKKGAGTVLDDDRLVTRQAEEILNGAEDPVQSTVIPSTDGSGRPAGRTRTE